MKNILLLIWVFYLTASNAQTMHVEGKDLYTVGGQMVTLRGINYPIIDEGMGTLGNPMQYKMKIEEAARTGANAMRIPWFTNGNHWLDQQNPGTVDGLLNDGTLSDIISYTHQQGMIPILELHDVTCSNDWDVFNSTIANWWKSPSVLDLIEENKEYLIINIANEFGFAMWTGNSNQAMDVFRNNYSTLISGLRQLGVEVPIMIDAPDCGQSSSELLSVAEQMSDDDPEHNLIFSAHAYWIGYANNQAAVEAKLNEAEAKNVYFLLGEIALSQDDGNGNCGFYDLSDLYPVILNEACTRDIGWLAWTYTQDCHAPRQMTPDGLFDNLTPYGEDLVYNQDYGLLSEGGCAAAPLAVIEVKKDETKFAVTPNPAVYYMKFTHPEKISKAKIFDSSGKLMFTVSEQFENVNISFLSPGNYIIQIETKEGRPSSAKLIKN